MKVGFIGLGIMGSRMAANLQSKGHELVVYNRSQEKAQELIEKGASWSDSPAAVGAQVEVIFTMLAHPEGVKAAAFGPDGFLDALPSGALWVDCSTVNPSFSREMAAAAQERKLRFLDAPVAGSKNQAAGAELVFFVGGAAADIEECQPLLNAMGRRVVHLGENGRGTSLKMVVNMVLATSMAAFAEGMALGQSLGLPQETLLSVLMGGPVAAPFLAGKQAMLTSGDYTPEFPLRWMHKDLHLATLTAYESGAGSLLATSAKELYALSVKAGYGESDFSAIYEFLNKSRVIPLALAMGI